mmetsp:Transcript_131537/g.232409  ORF Transcript_131537/g.232409 Transcript_131537/m.232409 type:complete len:238 (-) Transcript_131537:36-749(-)
MAVLMSWPGCPGQGLRITGMQSTSCRDGSETRRAAHPSRCGGRGRNFCTGLSELTRGLRSDALGWLGGRLLLWLLHLLAAEQLGLEALLLPRAVISRCARAAVAEAALSLQLCLSEGVSDTRISGDAWLHGICFCRASLTLRCESTPLALHILSGRARAASTWLDTAFLQQLQICQGLRTSFRHASPILLAHASLLLRLQELLSFTPTLLLASTVLSKLIHARCLQCVQKVDSSKGF